jgi:hypothetical protein
MQFLAAAGSHKENPEIVAKADEIKSKFIPPELVSAVLPIGGSNPRAMSSYFALFHALFMRNTASWYRIASSDTE